MEARVAGAIGSGAPGSHRRPPSARGPGPDAAMTQGRVRLGVLGAGNIADLNVAGYLEHPDCDVIAVCDRNGAKAAAAARRWGVPHSTAELSELLAMDLDAVEILTPTHLHAEHTIAALAAGLHVSVQKPVANSVGESRLMEAATT